MSFFMYNRCFDFALVYTVESFTLFRAAEPSFQTRLRSPAYIVNRTTWKYRKHRNIVTIVWPWLAWLVLWLIVKGKGVAPLWEKGCYIYIIPPLRLRAFETVWVLYTTRNYLHYFKKIPSCTRHSFTKFRAVFLGAFFYPIKRGVFRLFILAEFKKIHNKSIQIKLRLHLSRNYDKLLRLTILLCLMLGLCLRH